MKNKSMAIRFHQYGEVDVLRMEEIEVPDPQEGEVLIEQRAIGVNFIETYYRTGLYPTTFPSGLGTEGAGTVLAVGKGVTHLVTGDRVAYAQGPLGSYAERRVIPARFVVKIPDEVSFAEAASVMLKGLTVYYLFKDIHVPSSGEKILFHAAAGGVGLIACQWARHLGAQLIGTVSSDAKAALIKELGASEAVNYTQDDVVARVRSFSGGEMLPVVYDGVGKSTWEVSLDCLRPRGLMVSFGNASGAVSGVALGTLAQKGSLFVTRPVLGHYMDTPEKLQRASRELFSLVASGVIKGQVSKTYPLHEAGKAHRDLADRERVGGMVLIP